MAVSKPQDRHTHLRLNNPAVIQERKKKAGIQKEASVHTLRHSFATHLLEQGVNLFVIQKLLGHKYLQSTLIYLHLQDYSNCQVISPIDQILEDA